MRSLRNSETACLLNRFVFLSFWIWTSSLVFASKQPLLFITTAENEAEIDACLMLCESIRTFAGDLSQAPTRIYVSQDLWDATKRHTERAKALFAEFRNVTVPEKALHFFFGEKPYAAALAEQDAMGTFDCVAWLNANTIVIKPPNRFILPSGKAFAFAPVHHQRIGSLFNQEPDEFWTRLFDKLDVPDRALFPMKTVADDKTLRPYFSSGIFIFRPEHQIMRRWEECFAMMIEDVVFVDMCKQDRDKFIFLHQAALCGAVLSRLDRKELLSLPETYNYPIFFEKFFDAESKFDSIEQVVTLRYEFKFKDLPEDWDEILSGSTKVKNWIKERFSGGAD